MAFEKDWRVWLKAYAPIVLWIGVILMLGSPGGSMTETSKLIGPIIHFFWPNISAENELIVHYYVRKAAHFTEYGILAILTIRAMLIPGAGRAVMRFLPAIALVLLIASIDEFHQSFEPSRTASIYDVALDLTGGVTATIAAWLYLRSSRVQRLRGPASE